MPSAPRCSFLSPVVSAFAAALILLTGPVLFAQGGSKGGRDQSPNLRAATEAMRAGKTADALAAVRRELTAHPDSSPAANLLDVLGATAEARAVFFQRIEAATDPAARAAAQRAMAMSYAFDGDSRSAGKYEEMVIAYWVSRERAEPQMAFYQEGEMANEAARVCIDSGDLGGAEEWYRRGTQLGLLEPEPKTHPASLWEYRLAHALGRLAARRGEKEEAQQQIAAARKILDGDPKMAEQQERFFPYLVGYVALYTDDLPTAETQLTKAMAAPGNQNDPFLPCLLGLTYEKLGQPARATALYQKACDLATSHNPPAAFARPFARKKLGLN